MPGLSGQRVGTLSGRPSVVLGLCAFTHDSAAALVVGGHLVGMVEEERLCGVKHTKAYPHLSVTWLLKEAGLTAADIDVVAYNFSGSRYLAALPSSVGLLLKANVRSEAVARARGFAGVYSNYRQRMRILRGRFPAATLRPVLHHRAHGSYAFSSSGYVRAAVLILDSLGETQTTTIAAAARRDGDVLDYRFRQAIHDPASLGYVYGAVTQHLGWRRGDEEGTVMALAALGDPERFRRLFREAVRITPDAFQVDPAWFPVRTLLPGSRRVTESFVQSTCPQRAPEAAVDQVHADLAAALQGRTEEVVLHLARRTQQLTGSRRLCLGGGVAMNCVSVGKIVASGVYDEVHVPPAPGDSGTVIGAAIWAHQRVAGSVPNGVANRCYLGPRFDRHGDESTAENGQTVEEPARFLAERLAEGKIIGLFEGALEAGPRALGHRSILASPVAPDVVARLNATVKYREEFRPFAPVVLAHRAADYFRLNQASPYMSIAVEVTDLARQQIPAIVHANGTTRVQTVTAEQNPFLTRVLEEFAARIGVPVLINTSLNVKGKPICGTPDMALECLRESGLDGLMLDGRWIVK